MPPIFGIGGYAVGILSANGIESGWVQWPVALAGGDRVAPR